jgi:hypothetical protein
MRLMILVLMVLMLAGCGPDQVDCSYDRESMMQLDYRAFDQDIPWGGWRGVGRDPECGLVAADLIADWRQEHQEGTTPSEVRMLNWHEGQMRAKAGAYEAAAPLFESSKYADPQDAFDMAWNGYADASVAFVRRDRKALDTAYETMMAIEQPDDWEEFASESEKLLGERPVWPNNIEVVERLRSCFDRPYSEAYGPACDQ